MNRDDSHFSRTLMTDLTVFLVTLTVCSFCLTAATMLSRSTRSAPDVSPRLAMPQPPDCPELVPEPEHTLPAADNRIAEAPDGAIPSSRLPFHGIITQVAGRYEVDPSLVRAIIFAESGYNPRARSEKGARGLMQLMPATAKALGVQDVYDPKENIEGGVRYFRTLLDRFGGDVQLALAAYNAGSRHVRNYAGVPPFKATRRYIKKVLKFQHQFKMEKSFGARQMA
ncbi:lytic transglycosylase domain-containing protein [Desulfosarcina ovata]|nr:lytic transglycosylase domain-containing protein [Desulfosarcina ovata]